MDQSDEFFIYYYIWRRVLNIFFTIFDLGLCYALSHFAAYLLQDLIYAVHLETQLQLTWSKASTVGLILAIVQLVPLSLSHAQNPFSTSLVAYTCFLSYVFSVYALQHSRYQTKYKFWMFQGSFLYYSYLQTYPFCNTTLTNLVFMTFSCYQFLHNLFKFSYHLEMLFCNVQRGTLSGVLPAYIQNELQRRHTARTLGRQLEERRREREQRRQEEIRQRSQSERMASLEETIRFGIR